MKSSKSKKKGSTNQRFLYPSVWELLDRIEKVEKSLTTSLEKSLNRTRNLDQTVGKHEDEIRVVPIEEELATERAIPVVISSKSYLKMALHAKKYANPNIPKEEWVEVIGLLTGHIKNENTPIEQIIIDDAWPVGHGDAVSVSIIDTKSVTDVVDKLPAGRYIVGWYHSHPSYGNFLSTDDWATQSRYQALWNKSIAIVIDPTKITKHDQGYGVFRNTSNTALEKGYTELSTSVEGMSAEASFDILKMVREKLTFLEYDSSTVNG
ncbi:MAG: hypothetical protein ACW98K_08960 [Candidatus Kariarchaeaceae archaeon]